MAGKTKVTKLRIQIPKGMKVEDVVNRLEISFESAPPDAASPHWNTCQECCVDAMMNADGTFTTR